eukprot:s1859_g4.t1
MHSRGCALLLLPISRVISWPNPAVEHPPVQPEHDGRWPDGVKSPGLFTVFTTRVGCALDQLDLDVATIGTIASVHVSRAQCSLVQLFSTLPGEIPGILWGSKGRKEWTRMGNTSCTTLHMSEKM